jgi:peptide/nickel transport system substrate-binding protein
MKKLLLGITVLFFSAFALTSLAQTFTWPEAYAATAKAGGTIRETTIGDLNTYNILFTSTATDQAVASMFAGPGVIYRDWVGTRTFQNEAGEYNLFWASSIEEVQPGQEYIYTLKEGWKWSDGTEMTADDIITTFNIVSNPDVASDYYYTCGTVEDELVTYEKLGTYQFRVLFPKPIVNAVASVCPTLPAHIFGPAYEQGGVEGIQALWGIDTDVTTIVSGGEYMLSEYRPGERAVLTKNPVYGEFVKAADGTPMPGPDEWILTVVEDRNAELALCATGQCSFYYPDTLDRVAATQEAVSNGTIQGEFYPEIGPGSFTDYLVYNFNNTDLCKVEMFRNTTFRQAINAMIDRQALIDAALGGLGVAGYDYNTEASAPFDAPALREQPFEFNPEEGVRLLGTIGFTELGEDGVLMNPETGCRVEFTVQYNAGNTRRAQIAEVMRQTAEPYGVKINPREVSVEVWSESMDGTSLPRNHDFDAQVFALVGGDVDNPSGPNVFPIAANLNAWNKSKADAQPWEILVERLTKQMDTELDLDARVAIYNERAQILREQLPLTPLISPSFHYYHNMANVWPLEALDSNSIESPYNPGNYRGNLVAP